MLGKENSTVNIWFDNDFEIESKYHNKTVVLLLTAHILSLQDVVFRSMFSYNIVEIPETF